MGKITGFLEIERHDRDYVPVEERIHHWHEFVLPLPEKEIRDQAARCMGLRRGLLPRYVPAE
jgi:glutamate synthase (NADPH/NADH) small chain